jgi:hypothetical protein
MRFTNPAAPWRSSRTAGSVVAMRCLCGPRNTWEFLGAHRQQSRGNQGTASPKSSKKSHYYSSLRVRWHLCLMPGGRSESSRIVLSVNPNWTISQSLNGTQYSLSHDVIAGAGSFGQGQSVGLIVQQGTAYYLDIISTPVTGFQTSWTSESFTGTFDAANFRLQTGSGSSQPDFSGVTATTLGFTAFNGDSGTLTQYYDNISLTIAPIPEPSAWALFCLGIPALLAFRRAHLVGLSFGVK